ncbi:CRISPR-associated endonuclease Cas3'' [Myxococcus sp. K15C18031901]|uniref:CRISPR-associated endonuclease Cas3'' n=1 Tax=Myxococcus dinghuensis TaxID=2906761 RepID=UPI0020A7B4C1|nr:CRISPR-associated endonuclease Cas3'' [Myxococcus dinghuensis]MCP3105468.1 CRISPR-associated endonuclease Cas3'' [Myxococcus dinghuensis]
MSDKQPDCKDVASSPEVGLRTVTSEPLAHITQDRQEHLLREHLEEVGRLAATFAARDDMRVFAHQAGRWHDLGKYRQHFQDRIRKENGFEAHLERDADASAGSMSQDKDHSTAGALWALQKDPRLGFLAMAIIGHHGGLRDAEAFRERIRKKEKKQLLDEALARNPPEELLAMLPGVDFSGLERLSKHRFEFWTRMLFSALVDADFLDTEHFFDAATRERRRVDATLPALAEALRAFMDRKQSGAADTPVNRVRREVLSAVLSAAPSPPGVFSLTVPTGGGKTLTSMAFALEHARAQGLRRVIVAIPFTSIIEQSAGVYREAFGALGDAVIEHHSALDPRRETPLNRVASENWDAPVIVTTTVQLLESLFANRTSACRKLHNIAHSVIVLDEAQTLPPALLTATLDGLGTLVEDYGCSVVICTATQPALGRRTGFPEGFPAIRELVPAGIGAFERLRRVKVRWPESREPMPYAALAQHLARERDVLAVVHRRDDARKLCELVDAETGAPRTLHLSALMCPEHRSKVLADIKARKRRGEPVRLVATQLVEAGVDLDFAIVYRSLAGLDSLAQAAGRCNREGLLEGLGELRLYEAETSPPRGVPAMALSVTRTLREQYPDLDLFSPESFRLYFERLYANASRDGKGIQTMRAEMRFEAVSQAFKLVEDDWSAPVVVPFEGCEPWLDALRRLGPSRERLRALQRFTVTVPRKLRDAWVERELARFASDTVVYLGPEHRPAYDETFGLVPARVGILDPGLLIPG